MRGASGYFFAIFRKYARGGYAREIWILFFLLSGSGHAAGKIADDGVVRILAIGNSFSADAIENNLYDLAKEKNIRTVVANLYIGGAPLSLHLRNARENNPAYSYRKTSVDGTRKTVSNVSIETALADEDWDYISFQQASHFSGQLPTVEASLPDLLRYVKERAGNPHVKFIYHQTWAYSIHATHTGFQNYGNDQEKMYQAIVNVSKQVPGIAPIDILVPAGTAIQNARTSYLGDNFDRDGYHLRLSLGRYVAACTWFEKLFGIPVIGMKFKPADVTDLERAVAQHAAHFAVRSPYEVTPLKKFRKGPKELKRPAAPVLVDFGGVSHEGVWNPVVSPLAGKVYSMKDSLNNPTRVRLEMIEGFNGKDGHGAAVIATAYRFPAAVTGSSYFGNTKKEVNGKRSPQARFRITGLRPQYSYDISFFASRKGDSLGVQETRIVCEGALRQEDHLNATGNVSGLAHFRNVKPDAEGNLNFTVTAGARNTNPSGLYYLSALRLEGKKD